MTDTPAPTTTVLVYAGRRYRDGKLVEVFLDPATGENSIFSVKKRLHLRIGQSYAVPEPEPGMFVLSKADSLYAEPHEKTNEWRLDDAAADTRVQYDRTKARMEREAAEENRDLGSLTLDEIATKWVMANRRDRAALLAAVISWVQG